jgi:cob(I)alamin adenosyltransferase
MKIYTKTGDKGETSLLGGKRVAKDSLRIDAYGTVDELNSALGICRACNPPEEIARILDALQYKLFTLGADLATPEQPGAAPPMRIEQADIVMLEGHIDSIEPKLEPLKNFILPGGSPLAASLHVARTVSRRAERITVKLSHTEIINGLAVIYLNRLSDLLFVLARWANVLAGVSDTKWHA